MSKTEGERILTLELSDIQMAKDVQDIKDTQKIMSDKEESHHQEIMAKFETLEKKFASKWVERVVKGMVGLVLVYVFGAILSDVVVK